jgi:hypothetical protein
MKLTIATLAATLTLAGAASAMTESTSSFHTPRDAALGDNGQGVTGTMLKVNIDEVFEPRARALSSGETAYVTVFATDAPTDVQIDVDP